METISFKELEVSEINIRMNVYRGGTVNTSVEGF